MKGEDMDDMQKLHDQIDVLKEALAMAYQFEMTGYDSSIRRRLKGFIERNDMTELIYCDPVKMTLRLSSVPTLFEEMAERAGFK
jgi:hypothetical protein